MPVTHHVFQVLNSSWAQQAADPSGGTGGSAEASLAAVLCLVWLGLLGTAANLALLLAALRPLPAPAIPPALASALANLASAGIFESTVNATFSAYYSSGGFWGLSTERAQTSRAVLVGSLLGSSVGTAWGAAGVALASALQPTLARQRLLGVLAWPVAVGLGVATGFMLSRNSRAISNTPVVPREKVVQMSQELRYVQYVVGFGLPLLGLVGAGVLGARRALQARARAKQLLHATHGAAMTRPGLAVDTLVALVTTALYILLRAPFDAAQLSPGARPATLHSFLTWCRFVFCTVCPVAALVPGGRLPALTALLLRCCPMCRMEDSRPARRVSPPPPNHPAKQLLRQVALVQPRISNSVPAYTPVIFPTTAGLFLRLARLQHGALSPSAPEEPSGGYSYRAIDINTVELQERSASLVYSRASLERRDVFLPRDPRFLAPQL